MVKWYRCAGYRKNWKFLEISFLAEEGDRIQIANTKNQDVNRHKNTFIYVVGSKGLSWQEGLRYLHGMNSYWRDSVNCGESKGLSCGPAQKTVIYISGYTPGRKLQRVQFPISTGQLISQCEYVELFRSKRYHAYFWIAKYEHAFSLAQSRKYFKRGLILLSVRITYWVWQCWCLYIVVFLVYIHTGNTEKYAWPQWEYIEPTIWNTSQIVMTRLHW